MKRTVEERKARRLAKKPPGKKRPSTAGKAFRKAAGIVEEDPVPGVAALLGIADLPRGTLPNGGIHPAAYEAAKYIGQIDARRISQWAESFASCAISGKNELAEICGETLRRIVAREAVSDRYICSLAVIFMLDEIKRLRQCSQPERELRRRMDKARNLLLIQRHSDGETSKMIEEVLELLKFKGSK